MLENSTKRYGDLQKVSRPERTLVEPSQDGAPLQSAEENETPKDGRLDFPIYGVQLLRKFSFLQTG